MKKKLFSRKSVRIFMVWTFIAVVILCFAFIAGPHEGAYMQAMVGNVVKFYILGSCIIAPIIANVAENEKEDRNADTKKISARKSMRISLVWCVIGVILIGSVFIAESYKNVSLQHTMSGIIVFYIFASFILAPIVGHMEKKER